MTRALKIGRDVKMGEAKESEEKRKGGDGKPTFPPWWLSRSYNIAYFKKDTPKQLLKPIHLSSYFKP